MKQSKEWLAGVNAAAYVASDYNSCTTHAYRLDDCIRGKLNVGRLKPRRNKAKLRNPDDAWLCGYAVALSSLIGLYERTVDGQGDHVRRRRHDVHASQGRR